MSHRNVTGTLSADVADAGTFTVTYPTGTSKADFYLAMRHAFVLNGTAYAFPDQFDLTLGTSTTITVTNKSGSTWLAGGVWRLQLDEQGKEVYRDTSGARPGVGPTQLLRSTLTRQFLVDLGNPVVGASTAICASQSVTSGVASLLNGSTAGTLDRPRNVIAAWTNTAIATITGLDEYGNTMVEKSASGTSHTGTKAFKSVSSVTFNADVTGATVGTGNVLGLPVFLPGTGNVLRELQDGVAPTAGTLVAGTRTAGGATATTGDVRGTYAPNATPDGSKVFQLIVSLPDPGYLGQAHYAG